MRVIGLPLITQIDLCHRNQATGVDLSIAARRPSTGGLAQPTTIHFSWRETTFISWVGLRGAVPIVLALFPVIYDIDGAKRFFEVAHVIIISLLIQGSSVPLAARLLKVEVPPVAEPRHRADLNLSIEPSLEIVQFVVTEKSDAVGRGPSSIPYAGAAILAGVLRNGAIRTPAKTIAFASSPTTSFA